MILLILTRFSCCKQTDCQKPQICCLQWKACDALQRQLFVDTQETCNSSKHRYDSGRKLETNRATRDGSWKHREAENKTHKYDQSIAEAGVLVSWPHSEIKPAGPTLNWSRLRLRLNSAGLYFFPSSMTDRQRNRRPWSFSFHKQHYFNPLWIKGGSKLCLPFIREEYETAQKPSFFSRIYWTARFDQSIAVHQLWPKCSCSNHSPLKNGLWGGGTCTNFHQNSLWSENESNYSVLCYVLFQQKICCLTSTASVLKSHRSKHERLGAGERTE